MRRVFKGRKGFLSGERLLGGAGVSWIGKGFFGRFWEVGGCC